MRSIAAYVLIIFILFSSCNKDEPSPVNESIIKEGTIQCYTDGVLWETTFTEASYIDQKLTVVGHIYSSIHEQEETLWLLMWGNQSSEYHYSVDFKNEMQFARDISRLAPVGDWDHYGSNHCLNQFNGEVIITELDTLNNTISGKFSGKLYQNNCDKELSLTKGVFHKLKLLN